MRPPMQDGAHRLSGASLAFRPIPGLHPADIVSVSTTTKLYTPVAMSRSDDLSQTYLRFVKLVDDMHNLPTLDATEERVLNGLAVRWAKGEKPTVREAMHLARDASPATVHRRLKTLRDKGLIVLAEDASDNRIKYVEPTAQTKAYFAKLGQALDKATRGPGASQAGLS